MCVNLCVCEFVSIYVRAFVCVCGCICVCIIGGNLNRNNHTVFHL